MKNNNRPVNLSRRNSLKFVAGAIGTGILATRLGADVAAPTPAIAQNDMTPDAALPPLMARNKQFFNSKRINPHKD